MEKKEGKTFNFYGGCQYVEHIDSQTNNFHYYGDGQQHAKSPVEILNAEVQKQIDADADPKYILLPVRAAKEVPINVPYSSVKVFNDAFGTEIGKMAWSRWVNGTDPDYTYDDNELRACMNLFSSK